MRRNNRRDDVVFQARGRLTKLFNLRSNAEPTLQKLNEFVAGQAAKLRDAGMPVHISAKDTLSHGPAPARDWHDSFSRDLEITDAEGNKPRFVMNLHLDLHRRKQWELNVTVTLRRADTNSHLDSTAKGEILAKEYFEPENTTGIERFITARLAEVAAHMTHTLHPDQKPARTRRQKNTTVPANDGGQVRTTTPKHKR